tara:strand:- start:1466 stop:1639 length:174 start_codon:yes stop_codon:yes gene_type:complete
MEDGEYSSGEDVASNVNRVEDILGQRHLKSLLRKQKRRNIIKSKRIGVRKAVKWSSV